jgi:hypothetical protein
VSPYGCISLGNENEESIDPGVRGTESMIVSSHVALSFGKFFGASLGAILLSEHGV